MSTLALSPRQLAAMSQRRKTDTSFAVAALGLAVLAAVAIAVAVAISHLPDLGSLYITVT